MSYHSYRLDVLCTRIPAMTLAEFVSYHSYRLDVLCTRVPAMTLAELVSYHSYRLDLGWVRELIPLLSLLSFFLDLGCVTTH